MAKLLDSVPVIDGKHFTWRGNVGVAENSYFTESLFNRIYDDAADLGFKVRSHRTGREVLFFYTSDEKRDGEIVAWLFTSEDERTYIRIFND